MPLVASQAVDTEHAKRVPWLQGREPVVASLC